MLFAKIFVQGEGMSFAHWPNRKTGGNRAEVVHSFRKEVATNFHASIVFQCKGSDHFLLRRSVKDLGVQIRIKSSARLIGTSMLRLGHMEELL